MLLKNGANRLVQLRITTNLQFVKYKQINKQKKPQKPKNKTALSAKHSKVKVNQMKCACKWKKRDF